MGVRPAIALGLTSLLWASGAAAEPADEAILARCGRADPALSKVARDAALSRASGAPAWSAAELAFHVRRSGDSHVWPRAWSITGSSLHEDDVARRVSAWADVAPASGERRCGLGRAHDQAQRSVIVVIAVDALADMVSLPITPRVGQWLRLDAQLLVAASDAKVVLLGPRGGPKTILGSLSGDRVAASFAVDAPGRWLVQVLATTGAGPTPVLESVVHAGVAAPTEFIDEPAPGEEAEAASDEGTMNAMLSAARESEQLGALRRDVRLDRLAREHSAHMMRQRRIGHDVGDGDPAARIDEAGLSVRSVGENVASASTLSRAHRALWASPSHRKNMLDPGFGHVGVGVVRGADGTVWATQIFTE